MDLSVIIPAKNESLFLKISVPALWVSINKSNIIAEIILVDNGSEDDTESVARSLGCKILSSPQGSIAKLRNLGASQAQGTYLAFVDADCAVHEDWVSTCIENLNHLKVGATGTRVVPASEKATWVSWAWFNLAAGSKRKENVSWLGSSNLMLKKCLFDELGGFNEGLKTAEDFDLTTRLKKTHRIKLEKNIDTIHYREPETIKELFIKESWRGSSSLACYISNGCQFGELGSVAIPMFVNICIGMLVIFLLTNLSLTPIAIFPIIILPFILMIKKGVPFNSFMIVVQTYIVAFIFILARSVSLAREIYYILFRRSDVNIWKICR
ncbi:glycosyl transferase family 2 [Desulfobulbus propionicus DSM 2032]|uniref:Glycosyl transferase family 2 n=1 Tax=Desulfobulbus propionicus (strain ATCC 33891 / DSM 2032 / VKM B-1956 / 1pr3) TaxID=577650 RepID=A0A7U3YJS0_DESPD|nr:glycosyltransferase [Desulfobulbus propionicus]ADW16538.1 glycosyl transferase family 2 [Desulfobulbus propionicus DSM 2032]